MNEYQNPKAILGFRKVPRKEKNDKKNDFLVLGFTMENMK